MRAVAAAVSARLASCLAPSSDTSDLLMSKIRRYLSAGSRPRLAVGCARVRGARLAEAPRIGRLVRVEPFLSPSALDLAEEEKGEHRHFHGRDVQRKDRAVQRRGDRGGMTCGRCRLMIDGA